MMTTWVRTVLVGAGVALGVALVVSAVVVRTLVGRQPSVERVVAEARAGFRVAEAPPVSAEAGEVGPFVGLSEDEAAACTRRSKGLDDGAPTTAAVERCAFLLAMSTRPPPPPAETSAPSMRTDLCMDVLLAEFLGQDATALLAGASNADLACARDRASTRKVRANASVRLALRESRGR